MITWPVELINAIARRRAVIFIGSGISRNSANIAGKRPATWETFLKEAAKTVGDPPNIARLIDQANYLMACELLKTKLGTQKFRALVQAEYQQAGYLPADIHKHIYNLDSSIVASPNFDVIYETYAQGISAGSIVIKDHTNSDIINYIGGGEYRLFLKTHGSANAPGHLIFTRNEYAEARIKHRLFYELLKSLVLTHKFLFLGCGINDPDIQTLFEDVQFAYSDMPLHYMTLPKGEVDSDIIQVVRASMKLDFFEYAPDHGHVELTQSLADLVDKVEDQRSKIAADQKW